MRPAQLLEPALRYGSRPGPAPGLEIERRAVDTAKLLDIEVDLMQEREAGVAIIARIKRRGRGVGGGRWNEFGDGREKGGQVDADGEGDEEGAAEKEHLVAAKVPTRHSHRNEQHYACGQHPQLYSP